MAAGGCPRPSYAEAVPAATRLLGAGVVELDARIEKTALIVHDGAVEDRERARIHHDREPVVFEDEIARPRSRGEDHDVVIARAAARLHTDAEKLPLLALPRARLLHVVHGGRGQGDAAGGIGANGV